VKSRLVFGSCIVALILACGGCGQTAQPGPSAPNTPAKLDLSHDGVFKSGQWEYRFAITNPGTKSQGAVGRLFYDGTEVPFANLNDYYDTPWEPMCWVGEASVPWGTDGWMPRPEGRSAIGKPLGNSVAAPGVIVYAKVIIDGTMASNDKPEQEAWVLGELQRLGVKEPRTQGDWFRLSDTPVTIHDTKLYGRAQLRLGPAKDGKLIVQVSGCKPATIELSLQEGTQRVVCCALSSPLASLDLYVALRVVAPATRPHARPIDAILDQAK
jgi:hypothetical protein